MRKIYCPICKNMLFLMSDDKFVDFNLRIANEKIKCPTCKRKIEYSVTNKNTNNKPSNDI